MDDTHFECELLVHAEPGVLKTVCCDAAWTVCTISDAQRPVRVQTWTRRMTRRENICRRKRTAHQHHHHHASISCTKTNRQARKQPDPTTRALLSTNSLHGGSIHLLFLTAVVSHSVHYTQTRSPHWESSAASTDGTDDFHKRAWPGPAYLCPASRIPLLVRPQLHRHGCCCVPHFFHQELRLMERRHVRGGVGRRERGGWVRRDAGRCTGWPPREEERHKGIWTEASASRYVRLIFLKGNTASFVGLQLSASYSASFFNTENTLETGLLSLQVESGLLLGNTAINI